MTLWREDLARYGRKGLLQVPGAWIICPGFAVACYYRLYHRLRRGGFVGYWLASLLWRHVVTAFGCYISPLARIGGGLQLSHPVSVVIGDGVVIGRNVTVYQNVTIGIADAATPGYPIVEDEVTIYAGATIIGPVTIGRGATIAAHALVNRDVPPFTTAIGAPARIVHKSQPAPLTEEALAK